VLVARRLRPGTFALCADPPTVSRYSCWYRTPERKISIKLPGRRQAGLGCSSPPPAATPRLRFRKRAPKPILISSYGSSVRPAELVRMNLARHYLIQSLSQVNIAATPRQSIGVRRSILFHQRQGPQHRADMIVLPPALSSAKKYSRCWLTDPPAGARGNNPDQIGLRWNYHLLAAPGYVILMTDYTGSTSFARNSRKPSSWIL